MDEIWTAVTAWPVIVQGALGSAVFAAFIAVLGLIPSCAKFLREGWIYQRRVHELYYVAHIHPDNPIELRSFGLLVVMKRALRSLHLAVMLAAIASMLPLPVQGFAFAPQLVSG